MPAMCERRRRTAVAPLLAPRQQPKPDAGEDWPAGTPRDMGALPAAALRDALACLVRAIDRA